MENIITIELKNSPLQRTIGKLKEVLQGILSKGEFVHCIDVFDQGTDRAETRYVVRIFTAPGLCKHDSINGCVEFLENVNAELWFALDPYLKNRMDKIIEERRAKEESKERRKLHVVVITKIFNATTGSEKTEILDDYIKYMAFEYLEYYTMDALKSF